MWIESVAPEVTAAVRPDWLTFSFFFKERTLVCITICKKEHIVIFRVYLWLLTHSKLRPLFGVSLMRGCKVCLINLRLCYLLGSVSLASGKCEIKQRPCPLPPHRLKKRLLSQKPKDILTRHINPWKVSRLRSDLGKFNKATQVWW